MAHPLERIRVRNLKYLATELQQLLEARLWAQILLGMALGFAVGVALGPSTGWIAEDTAVVVGEWLALPGQLFLAAIQMVVVPLVVASVVRGIAASGDLRQLRSTGVGLALYFLITTVLATGIGVAVAYLVRPGEWVDPGLVEGLTASDAPPVDAPADDGLELREVPSAIVGLLPQNPLSAMVQGQMLQVVIFGVVLGAALISLEPKSSRPLFELMGSLQEVSMKIVSFVMRLAPLAVFGLLAKAMIRTGAGVLVGLGVYALSVVGALLALLVLYLVIVAVLGRRNPLRFLRHIREPQLLAFSTDSSAATMPVSIRTAQEDLAVRPSTAQLVIPMGATMNMGGTACYHGIATLFMAQLFGMDLGPSALLALLVTSLGSSLGAPATPGVGIMILATVLTSAGVPLGGLALIIGLDQILERVRCVMNVSGDLVACVVVDRYVEGKHTREEELADEARLEGDVETVPAS
jgi:Na+/H+-dicarboxylate symporter